MSFLDQLRDSVDARISEVTQEIAALEAALVALRDDAPSAADSPRRRGRPTGSRNRTNGARPTSAPVAVAAPSSAPVGLAAVPSPDAKPAKRVKPVKRKVAEAAKPVAESGAADPAGAPVVELVAPQAPKAFKSKAPKARKAAQAASNGARPADVPESPAKPKAAGRGRSVQPLVADRLTAMLGESSEGLSAISISKQAGAGYNQVLSLLRQLEEAGDVRRTGTRRTSLWRRVTDEERIAERAQELAGLASAG